MKRKDGSAPLVLGRLDVLLRRCKLRLLELLPTANVRRLKRGIVEGEDLLKLLFAKLVALCATAQRSIVGVAPERMRYGRGWHTLTKNGHCEDVDGGTGVVAESGEGNLAQSEVLRVGRQVSAELRADCVEYDVLVELHAPVHALLRLKSAEDATTKAAGDGGVLVVGGERTVEGRGGAVEGRDVANVLEANTAVLLVSRPVSGLTFARAEKPGSANIPALAAAKKMLFGGIWICRSNLLVEGGDREGGEEDERGRWQTAHTSSPRLM